VLLFELGKPHHEVVVVAQQRLEDRMSVLIDERVEVAVGELGE
jgi:hypothetical protein